MALDEQIHALERALKDGVGRKIATASTAGPARKRVLSAAARERIAAAQRKRWAAVRKAKKKGR